ncbi:fatty-acyl-CoA synthase [Nitrosomonas eutropha]|uniref:fatty acyl-AMP ligase n=1 Tax=Nitrosomonas TaxID=914 RepID=UPI00088A30BA|nr:MULTISPECIES: fatty acyl-AMP ligase [Nitrosomonas]MXS79629.1 fatty acyl-AMP ligase [Nitrosomonas sp. GH22]SCX02579.1 fatty-acyl-CoA synthase [Nitrosomonas eutropha]SDW22563.1 fatty-acyl-CoA synthase [Nitrosomonas eutropha]
MSSIIAKLDVLPAQEGNSLSSEAGVVSATPTINLLNQRRADFTTLVESLEYAAQGETGHNFYDAKGNLKSVLTYKNLCANAKIIARRLSGLGLARNSRVALIADTTPEFVELFFACRFAGLVPFAMPVPVNLGSRAIYVQQLKGMLGGSGASVAIANLDFIEFLNEVVESLGSSELKWSGTPEQLNLLPEADVALSPNTPDETAYLQFTSGSTRLPRGVVITERALMTNLRGIVCNGLDVRPGDRCASWLPFYHDMGLVGLVLAPLAAQLSVDYLATRDFAVRPLQWLKLISRNRCTIAFSQPFGLKLCTLRARDSDLMDLDLSCWRAAGVGAEMIRLDTLKSFSAKFSAAGFNEDAFLPCYGLAESTLAVSFPDINQGVKSLRVDAKTLIEKKIAVRVQADGRKFNEFVNCGRPLPGHEIRVVDDADQEVPHLMVGSILVKGESVMNGYFNNAEETARAIRSDGWLDTGDIGFLFEGDLYITGRRTDVIIVNGRNIRAQDVEELAEQQPEVRTREASAFGISDENGSTSVVLVVECRLASAVDRQALINRLQQMVYMAFGVSCLVELVPPHTLPRTSSGKLSRFAARQGFLRRTNMEQPAATSYTVG